MSTAKLLRSIQANGIPRDAELREDGARTWLPVLNVPEFKAAFASHAPAPATPGKVGVATPRSIVVRAGIVAGLALLVVFIAAFGVCVVLKSPSLDNRGFADHTEEYKGKEVTLVAYLQEVEHTAETSRVIHTANTSAEVEAAAKHGSKIWKLHSFEPNFDFSVLVQDETRFDVKPRRGDKVIVTFLCKQGEMGGLFVTNTLLKVRRP